MFGLVMPEKVAEAVVAKDVKMIFDPATKELIKVVMPFASKTEVMTLTVDKGWVTEASVEDTKLLPGVHRTMFRLQGGEWVTREIVKDVQSGRAKFVVNSGDAVWWGNQRLTVNDSPYWKRVNDTMLKKLPAPDDEMRAAGLDGRFFMSVGNHEVWADPKIEGVLSAVPYLKKFGVTPENLIYKFDFKGTRFIYLWSGKYDYRSPSLWDADRPKYAEQMTQLQKWMDEAKANGIRKAFIVFHYPVFARSGLGPKYKPTTVFSAWGAPFGWKCVCRMRSEPFGKGNVRARFGGSESVPPCTHLFGSNVVACRAIHQHVCANYRDDQNCGHCADDGASVLVPYVCFHR